MTTTLPPELDNRFRSAAATAGLLDVAYDVVDSPLGSLLVAATPRGVCRIAYDPEPEREAETLARAFGRCILRSPRTLDEPKRELDDYFEGRRRTFDLPLDLAATALRRILPRRDADGDLRERARDHRRVPQRGLAADDAGDVD